MGHGSLLQCPSTRAALARPGPAATPFPDVDAPLPPSDSLPPSATAPVPLAQGLPRCGRFVLCPKGPTTRAPATGRASETSPRLSVTPGWVEARRGPPRLRDRPLRTCHGRTPRRRHLPPCPEDTSAGGGDGLQTNLLG